MPGTRAEMPIEAAKRTRVKTARLTTRSRCSDPLLLRRRRSSHSITARRMPIPAVIAMTKPIPVGTRRTTPAMESAIRPPSTTSVPIGRSRTSARRTAFTPTAPSSAAAAPAKTVPGPVAKWATPAATATATIVSAQGRETSTSPNSAAVSVRAARRAAARERARRRADVDWLIRSG